MAGSTALYVLVIDNDDDIRNNLNEFVDSFAINMDSDLQVGGSLIKKHIQGTDGWATMSLTVRLLCAEHYYGECCENLNCSALQINCSGRGICIDGVGTYSCVCNPGYIGRDCETNINECLLMEPQCSGRGTCTDGDNSFTCDCNEGYTDLMCETNIDDCVGVNCSGHGQCMDNINSFTCHCSEGFTGLMCQTNIDDCIGVNCSGHGQCMDGVNNFTCLCQSGFTGVLCSKNVQDQSSGSSAGGIAGGVIGALVVMILIVLLIILIITLAMKRTKGRHSTDTQVEIDLKQNVVYGVKPTRIQPQTASEVHIQLQQNIVYGRRACNNEDVSNVGHEATQDMNIDMNPNTGYGTHREQNLSTGQSSQDMYDYVVPNF